MKSDEPLYFADVCAGPGGFSEYVLWKRKWRAKVKLKGLLTEILGSLRQNISVDSRLWSWPGPSAQRTHPMVSNSFLEPLSFCFPNIYVFPIHIWQDVGKCTLRVISNLTRTMTHYVVTSRKFIYLFHNYLSIYISLFIIYLYILYWLYPDV